MLDKNFILKGTVIYSLSQTEGYACDDSYVVCVDGKSAGVFKTIPARYEKLPVLDCGKQMIMPGMTDLHTHASQYVTRAFGMDYELMEWLVRYPFPEEARYADTSYADAAYDIFTNDLMKSSTTRAVIFATLHREATEILMDKLENSGMITQVGLVEMDRNCPDFLIQPDTESAIKDTYRWLEDVKGKYEYTSPILTPRFAPSCSEEQLEALGKIQKEFGLPVQSHLSESPGEIAFVSELFPWSKFYGEVYDRFGLFGGENCPTVMAHCVHCSEPEIALMKERGVFVAHCPDSNIDLTSGIAPARRYLEEGINMGLGTDVSGGVTLNMLVNIADTIRSSKTRWRLMDSSLKPLSVWEAFYLATMGGGAYFGKVGSFLEGYEFDAVVLDDSRFTTPRELDPISRMEQIFYLGQMEDTVHKFVAGRQLF